MLTKYDTTIFFVEDIDAAANWYSSIVGADVKYENDRYAYLEAGEFKIGFHPEDAKSSHGTNGQTTYWRVASLQAAIDILIDKGATLYRGPMCTSLNEHTCILVDPFGNTVGLVSGNA